MQHCCHEKFVSVIVLSEINANGFVFIREISLYILIHISNFSSCYIHQAFLSAFQTFREVV